MTRRESEGFGVTALTRAARDCVAALTRVTTDSILADTLASALVIALATVFVGDFAMVCVGAPPALGAGTLPWVLLGALVAACTGLSMFEVVRTGGRTPVTRAMQPAWRTKAIGTANPAAAAIRPTSKPTERQARCRPAA